MLTDQIELTDEEVELAWAQASGAVNALAAGMKLSHNEEPSGNRFDAPIPARMRIVKLVPITLPHHDPHTTRHNEMVSRLGKVPR